ncbi:hypothetical protein [Thiomicrospira microaerophila]|uniref:hypothetical protein n=1 Tax=Thiomicrospira microaerophila TaxID=406020 RepID=UPI0005CAD9AD|nr:hypothetical protein [Thiomicrospira microaerophila]
MQRLHLRLFISGLLWLAGVGLSQACAFEEVSAATLAHERVCLGGQPRYQSCVINDHPLSKQIARVYLQAIFSRLKNLEIAGKDSVDRAGYQHQISTHSRSWIQLGTIEYLFFEFQEKQYVCAITQ